MGAAWLNLNGSSKPEKFKLTKFNPNNTSSNQKPRLKKNCPMVMAQPINTKIIKRVFSGFFIKE